MRKGVRKRVRVDAESVSRESHGRMYWLDLSYSKVLVRVKKGPRNREYEARIWKYVVATDVTAIASGHISRCLACMKERERKAKSNQIGTLAYPYTLP